MISQISLGRILFPAALALTALGAGVRAQENLTVRVTPATLQLKVGQEIEVMVIDVEPGDRRISLSIKAAREGASDYRAYMTDQTSGSGQLGAALGEAIASGKVAASDQGDETDG